MDSYIICLILFSIILIVGELFQKSTIPLGLILVITGMLLSFIPFFPAIQLDHNIVLNLFLPLLVYQISSFSSWRDMKKHFYPIALLSIGHVIFIALLVAIAIHTIYPAIGWPISFVLGAIISPPDSVAIVSIAEKIQIPERIHIILEGEGMFNDATALTLFRFALAAAVSSQTVSFPHALSAFSIMIVGEVAYGFAMGHIIGKLRTKISNTSLHVLASFITPFLAYIPVIKLGGSGIIATAIVGFIIGNQYSMCFTPGYRLIAFTAWPMLAFTLQSLIFLLVGLDLRSVYSHISSIPLGLLFECALVVTSIVILGRFIYVYVFVSALPRLFFPSLRKKDTYPIWKYPFIISWSGVRGGISLAAALAIPTLILKSNNIDIRNLVIFLVFSVIFVTLILQGLSLPYFLKKMKLDKVGQSERYKEHLSELQTRIQMIDAALLWLHEYKRKVKNDKKQLNELSMYINEYQMLKKQFESRILDHNSLLIHDEQTEIIENLSFLYQLVEVEKNELLKLWREDKINLKTRNKLIAILDHQIQKHII